MRTVHKYRLMVEDEQVLTMPEGARLLHLGQQLDGPVDELQLWAEVDTDEPAQVRTFRIYGTGHPMPEDEPLHYVGTVVVWMGLQRTAVWHVYEWRSPEHFQRGPDEAMAHYLETGGLSKLRERGEVVGEVSNEPGWIGEAHGPPEVTSMPTTRPWRDKPRGGDNGR